jgi:hypothetical protein
VSSINTSAMAGDTTVNPFAYVDTKILHVANTSTVKATFNGTNTVVTFTGNNPIKSTYTFNYGGSGNGKPHFGLDPSSSTGGGPAFTVVSQYWSNKTAKAQMPSLSIKQPALVGTNFKYALFFADATSNGQTVGQWFETPYTTTQAPKFSPQVFTQGNVTLSNVGFQLSPTLIPLDNLNFANDPPPGTSGSPFTSLPSLNGTTLTSMPEPSSALLAVGLTGLLLRRWRRHAT